MGQMDAILPTILRVALLLLVWSLFGAFFMSKALERAVGVFVNISYLKRYILCLAGATGGIAVVGVAAAVVTMALNLNTGSSFGTTLLHEGLSGKSILILFLPVFITLIPMLFMGWVFGVSIDVPGRTRLGFKAGVVVAIRLTFMSLLLVFGLLILGFIVIEGLRPGPIELL